MLCENFPVVTASKAKPSAAVLCSRYWQIATVRKAGLAMTVLNFPTKQSYYRTIYPAGQINYT